MNGRLEVRCLHAGYGRSMVLHNINRAVDAGRSLAILGHNGAGKSTLLATLAGITQQHQGRILLDGYDLSERPPIPYWPRAGYRRNERCHYADRAGKLTAVVCGPWTVDAYALLHGWPNDAIILATSFGRRTTNLAIARGLVLNLWR